MPGVIPKTPKVYHITHVDNLPLILESREIWSDRERIKRGMHCTIVGMSKIKERRLEKLEVTCHANTFVGEYVPFYFCPRSIMLYILHCRNHPELSYRDGQEQIIHLEADLRAVIEWSETKGRNWAFTTRNAGAYVVKFYKSLDQIDKIDWNAIANTDFRDPVVKEVKQAKFLLHRSFPWHLVEKVGVCSSDCQSIARQAIRGADHQTPVQLMRDWYY